MTGTKSSQGWDLNPIRRLVSTWTEPRPENEWRVTARVVLRGCADDLEEALRVVDARMVSDDWHPIETAPGIFELLVWRSGWSVPKIGSWFKAYDGSVIWYVDDEAVTEGGRPTHWKPLPAPPKDGDRP